MRAIEMSEEDAEYALSAVVSREGRVQGVEMINQRVRPAPAVNAMLNEAYRMKFAPAHGARRRGGGEHGVAGGEHHGEGPPRRDMQALRQALRLRTTPAPIAPLPIPAGSDGEPKPAAAPLMKPVVPDALAMLPRRGWRVEGSSVTDSSP